MIPNPKLIPRFNIDYDFNDFRFSVKCLIGSSSNNYMSSIFPESKIIFTNSGRASLYLILNNMELSPKSKIGIPLYSCPSNFDSIINAGHIPVFIDVDIHNFTLDVNHLAAKIHELDAVVVIHTFGRPADMDNILKIAGNTPIIEDCAHALLSKYDDSMLGTIGIAGYFSFRSGKYISAGEGGMVVTSDSILAHKITEELETFPEESTKGEITHALKTYLRSVLYHRPFFGLVSLPFGSLIEKKVDIMNKYSFKLQKIRKTDFNVVNNKMKLFPLNVEKQRNNSFFLLNNISLSGLKEACDFENTYCNYFLFPLIAKNKSLRDSVVINLRKKNIDTTQLFSTVPFIANKLYGYFGDCPNTEYLCDRIITVPNFYVLNDNDLKHIVECINQSDNGGL